MTSAAARQHVPPDALRRDLTGIVGRPHMLTGDAAVGY
jgi:hypothetical protein